jgi:hypothetical protein
MHRVGCEGIGLGPEFGDLPDYAGVRFGYLATARVWRPHDSVATVAIVGSA